GDFLSSELLRVLNEIGVDKFSAIVSDHAANIVLAKRLIADKYPHIIPVRCIAHHINLLTNDIMKLNWSSKIIKDCKKVVKYFRKSHVVHEYLQEEITNFNITSESLKAICENSLDNSF